MSKSQKFVSLSDVISNFEKTPEFQQLITKMKQERDASPARHERKFNLDLMNYSAEINFQCQQIGYITNQVLNNASEYTEEQINELFDRRQQAIFDLARVQQKHDDLVRKLDSEIVLEDFQKRNKN